MKNTSKLLYPALALVGGMGVGYQLRPYIDSSFGLAPQDDIDGILADADVVMGGSADPSNTKEMILDSIGHIEEIDLYNICLAALAGSSARDSDVEVRARSLDALDRKLTEFAEVSHVITRFINNETDSNLYDNKLLFIEKWGEFAEYNAALPSSNSGEDD